MRTLYLDCAAGASGDMILGSLMDLGVSKEYLIGELEKLNVRGYDLVVQKKERHGIMMTDVDVQLCPVQELEHADYDLSGRNQRDILQLIEACDLPPRAKEISRTVFREIARAEARVHKVPSDKVTFHEKGALDSIVDIVGAAVCIAALDVDRIQTSELHDGYGYIMCRFGRLPVPVPAVAAMLEGTGIPVIREDICTELITPTGMGLIKCLSQEYGPMPAMKVERIGYGSGKRETGLLGAVRAVIGESEGCA